MVAVLHELNPPVAETWKDALARVHETLDELGDLDDSVTACEYASLLRQLDRAQRRLDGFKFSLVARAQADRVADRQGFSDTGAWLADTTQAAPRAAIQTMKLADSLERRLPATRQALVDGDISKHHAGVIENITRTLPRGLSQDQLHRVEADLLEVAAATDPVTLRRAGRRALASIEPDETVVDEHEDQVLHSEEERAYDRATLTLRDNGDGTATGHFTIPSLAASILGRALDAMASPRRAKFGATHDQSGEARIAGLDSWERRAGQAFTELLERLPIDHLSAKTAASIVVTLDFEQLQGRLKAAGVDTGEAISAGTARRLACQAKLLPAVLGKQSQILDLGRAARLFTQTQRTALATRHSTCAAHGCQRPYAWTELHHRTPWSLGGATNLKEAIPLCGFHHRRIHDPAYDHLEKAGPTGLPLLTFHRRT